MLVPTRQVFLHLMDERKKQLSLFITTVQRNPQISERERLLHKPESSADDRDLMIGARIMYNEEDLVRVDELARLSAIRIIELLHTLQPKIISPSKYHDTISIEHVEDRQPSRPEMLF